MARLPHRASSPRRGCLGHRWWETVVSRGFHLHLLLILLAPQPPWVSSASPALSLGALVLLARRCSIHSAGLKPQLESPSAFDPRVRRGAVLSAGEILAPGGQGAQVQHHRSLHALLPLVYRLRVHSCTLHLRYFSSPFIVFLTNHSWILRPRRRAVSCNLILNFHFYCTHLMRT